MADYLISWIAVVEIALAAFGLGRPILRGLRLGVDDALDILVWSVSLGFLFAGMLWAVLGMCGALYWPVVGVITLSASFAGLGQLFLDLQPLWMKFDTFSAPVPPASRQAAIPPPRRWLLYSILALAGLASGGALISAMAPPTAGDALCYHLELPKTFLQHHAMVFLPYSETSTYPLLAEMWYLWALVVGDGVTAQIIHWLSGVLLAMATVMLGTAMFGRGWGWLAGAIVLLVPGITNQMSAPMNDVAVALYTTLAVVAWRRATVDHDDRRWFVLAGLMFGGALSIKYHAIVLVLAVAATAAWQLVRGRTARPSLLAGVATVAIVAVSVSGMWYVRAAVYRGNPVYPFLSHYLGTPGPPVLRDSKRPLPIGPLAILQAPWKISMHPERFGGRGHRLGIMFLMALPALLVARRLRGLRGLLSIASVYFGVWYLTRQNVRFLYPIVPMLAVATVWLWIELRRFPRAARLAAAGMFAASLMLAAGVPLLHAGNKLPVAIGLQNRDDYLLRSEPTYAAAEVANCVLPKNARLLSQDYRAFYFDCAVVQEATFRRLTHYEKRVTSPKELSPLLKKAGFTHLLLAENVGGQGIHFNDTLSRLADAQLAHDEAAMRCLVEYRVRDRDGALRSYRLMQLN